MAKGELLHKATARNELYEDRLAKDEYVAGGSTVTKGKVEAGGRGEQDQDMAEGREEQGMHGGPNNDEYMAGGSTFTKGKLKARGKWEQE